MMLSSQLIMSDTVLSDEKGNNYIKSKIIILVLFFFIDRNIYIKS